MERIIIDYDKYLELVRKAKKLEEIKENIEIHYVEDTKLGLIVAEIIMNNRLKSNLVMLKKGE